MTDILIAEIKYYDPADAAEKTLRVGAGAYTHPSAPGPYFDAIRSENGVATVRREIFRNGQAFGSATNDYGVITIANLGGQYDWLIDCATDGRAVRLLIGPQDGAYSEFQVVFTGIVAQMQVGVSDVVVRIHDAFSEALDKKLTDKKFLGSNVLPNGIEGGEDIKDVPVPVLYGKAINVPLICVNTSKLIYCIADRGAVSVSQVRDKGAILTLGSPYASLADLQATAPSAGQARVYAGSATEPAYLRLGSSPSGEVTADVQTGASAADRTAAQLWSDILTERAGVVGVSASDVAALDVLNSAVVGCYAEGDTQIRDALDSLAGSVGAGYWQDRDGVWRVRRIEAPSGAPVAKFVRGGLERDLAEDEADILEIEPLFTARGDAGVPAWAVKLFCARNYYPQDKDALAGIALDRVQRLSREWLEARAEDTAVKTIHPLADELDFETAFDLQSAASTEATRRLTLFSQQRRRYRMTVQLTKELASIIDLGVIVSVEHDRMGLSSGKLFVVTALELDLLDLTADLIVWG